MNSPAWNLLLIILFILSLALRHELLFFFVILLALASLASRLWMRYCLEAVTYKRALGNTRLNFGEETDLIIEVTNAKLLPLAWLMALDKYPQDVTLLTKRPDKDEPQIRFLSNLMALRWYERVRRIYRIRGDKRGEFVFGPADVTSGDVFGFAWRHKDAPETDTLLVYPKVVPISRLGLPPAWPLAEEKAAFRLIDDPLRMATVREYIPGDSMRHLHWKATARLNRLQTKVFDPGASRILYLFADVQTSANPYSLTPEYLELVITATASIALHALSAHQAVALYTNSGIKSSANSVHIPASRHPAQATQILESLARLDAFRQQAMGNLLFLQSRNLPYGSTVVVITALPSEEIMRALLHLHDSGHAVVLLTVGDKPLMTTVENIKVYHLGGRDVWRHLETLELG
jgi:uncharacterized protein (DUF58 family)